MQKRVFFGVILLLGTCNLVFANYFAIGAQTPSTTDLGIQVSINDSNVQNGDIICSGAKGYTLCNIEYDTSIYGIVDNNPSAAITIGNLTNPQIVVTKGETTARV